MKLLKDILYKCSIVEVHGTTNVAIASVTADSRNVDKYALFVAISGTTVDGHKYITDVVAKGAIAVVCESLPETLDEKVTYVVVKNSKSCFGFLSCNFYDNPSEKLKLIGVTGTNGKTTVTTLLFNLFSKLGYKCGLLSTVVNKIINEDIPATHTTPDALTLNQLLTKMLEAGVTHAFMEVSSHALDQGRVDGIHFSGAIFTNITHDHLDYHKTFEHYLKSKKLLFDHLSHDAFALVNKDDKNGEVMLQNTNAQKLTYSLHGTGDFKAKVLENHFNGLYLSIDSTEVWTKLIGRFNAYNLIAAYGAAKMLKEEKINILAVLSNLNAVEGRFQYFRSEDGITCIVDYAHTPDALKNVLNTIADIRGGNEQVITLIGCGGNRDPFKRPEMARIACEMSDLAILTSDNPRNEKPEDILNDMLKGCESFNVKKYLSIVDRKEAIKTAVRMAKSGDIILVAGKGHEKYQEINGVKHPFDDLQVLKELFN